MGILDGKAVVITGAGRGLGRASAVHAAAWGAAVVVNDIDEQPAIHTCLAEFGRIDGLVNNAGLRYQGPGVGGHPRSGCAS